MAARLLWRFGADEPLLYSHQYHYWEGALRILEHPRPFTFIATSDEWREWPMGGPWTIAPLYYLFAALVLWLSGGSLTALLVVQSALDSGVAVAVGWLGARAAGSPRGAWAGLGYAVFWPSIQLCNSTMTEALHTPLLALGFVLLARLLPGEGGPLPASRRLVAGAALAGLAFGLGGLARTVGLAFVPLAALLLARGSAGRWLGLARWRAAAVFALFAAIPVVPWAIRNRVVLDDPSPIESASIANLLIDNVYVEPWRYDRIEHFVFKEKTPAERRERALSFVEQGLRKRYHLIPAKIRHNASHILRPEGLWVLLGAQQPWPAWRHALNVGLDDVLLLCLAFPLFVAWLFAGRGPLRVVLLAWALLYLFLVIVVFHTEIRYRMPLIPYVFAGAAGGAAMLGRPERRRPALLGLGLAAVAVIGVAGVRFAPAAWRGAVSFARLQEAGRALGAGDLARADTAARHAAAADPASTWPWIRYARWLVRSGRPAEALGAYERAAPLREVPWEPPVARPALLAALGRHAEVPVAAALANRASHAIDSWLMLDVAWRALPPPTTDEVLLARGDYGAVHDFHQPRDDYRWGRATSRVRFRPRTWAVRYELEIEMAWLHPAPGDTAEVEVRVAGEPPRTVTVGRAMAVHAFNVGRPAGGVFEVEIEAPPWSHTGFPAAQGVAVRRVGIVPLISYALPAE
ncbi:MAG TPA: hypothetical protein VFM29_03175 [Vicinamibacteria bacterium]|nr:hypothetical protein [Vicinamibacteria bacterium]